MKVVLTALMSSFMFASAVIADKEDIVSKVVATSLEMLPAVPADSSMVIVNFSQNLATPTAKLEVKIGTNSLVAYTAESSQSPQTQRNLRVGSEATVTIQGATAGAPAFITYKLVRD